VLVRILLLLAIGAIAEAAAAHEIRPAFLQIREIEPATYDLLWKTPAQGDMRLALNVILPRECADLGAPRVTLVHAAVIERRRSRCNGGLLGKRVVIENLETSLTDVIVRFEPMEGSPKTLRVDGAGPVLMIPERQPWSAVAGAYFHLGVEHILFGFDHLLFVLCLLLLVKDFKRLLAAITSFTVAHSITLAATTFGWLSLAAAPVEACIALSIALLAAGIVKPRDANSDVAQRWPWIASFGFGLLHGFGFAAALRDIGVPEDAVPLALLFFNLGVEAGQIVFVAVVLALLFLLRAYAPRPPAAVRRAPPYIAGIVASYWFIERTMRIFV
jgi:hydrogenase/urease accessory protein HupE